MQWRRAVPALLTCCTLAACTAMQGSSELQRVAIPTHDRERARDALTDAIADEGLIAAPIHAFGDMLARTGPALGHEHSPYLHAEMISFCSAAIAWSLALEDAHALPLCPLGVAVYARASEPDSIYYAWREPAETHSPALNAARALLRRIVDRARRLAGDHSSEAARASQ